MKYFVKSKDADSHITANVPFPTVQQLELVSA